MPDQLVDRSSPVIAQANQNKFETIPGAVRTLHVTKWTAYACMTLHSMPNVETNASTESTAGTQQSKPQDWWRRRRTLQYYIAMTVTG